MKFFIPGLQGEKAEDIYNDIKLHVINNLGCTIKDTRIYRLDTSEGGKEMYYKVGYINPITGTTVFAILETNQQYLVCAAGRGALNGLPILVGRNEVDNIQLFDS